jgi:hypothetical protein
VPGTDRPAGRPATRLLATGLLLSAGLLTALGGWAGLAIGVAQAVVAVALLLRPSTAGPLAGAILLLVPAPLAAVRHWTARLPGACRCVRLPHPPPGLVSLTGLVVALDLLLLGLAMWLTAAHRQRELGKSSR